jgi:hypothetical protein
VEVRDENPASVIAVGLDLEHHRWVVIKMTGEFPG